MRLLMIEDDRALVSALLPQLADAGYDTDVCESGADAPDRLATGDYGAVILDRMLPGLDGLSVLRNMRGRGDATPVLMLTALDTVRDRTDGLDAGADDYLVKPFAVPELLSRLRALIRRSSAPAVSGTLSFCGLSLDPGQYSLRCGASVQTLSRRETALFELFLKNPEHVLSRAEILSRVWGSEAVEDGNVDNYIYFIRRRLKAAGSIVTLKTVHGVGYQLTRGEKR